MSVAFTISLPAEPTFRQLAAEVAGKYVELVGGSAADAATLAASIGAEIDKLVDGSRSTGDVELVFESDATGIGVTVRCAGRSAVVKRPIPARKA
jgi:hypothetical protein